MTLREYIDTANAVTEGYIVAALTDEYIVNRWPMSDNLLKDKEGRILEIRIFNSDRELKLVRPDVSCDFIFRDSLKLEELDSFDEKQFLDIDTKKGKDACGKVKSTGGGSFYLPVEKMNDACVIIRNYLEKYDESGQARICDWRLVDFIEGK